MKKVMIAAVILLPLIILMVLLISGTVVGSVQHIYVESIEFTEEGTLVLVKDSEEPPQATLSVNVFPRAATNKEVMFSSSDESVVTVDENGVVYGEDFGEAYIYAQSAENGSARIARRVLVTDDVVHEVVFENTVRQLYTGRSAQLTVRVRPQEAADQSIVWSSSDPSVLAVAADGTVTAKKAGTAEITARSAVNADASAVLQIECKAPVQSVDIADRSAVTLAERTAVFPQVLFTPAEADEAVAYSVSDEAVASVDGEGNILFKKAGRVTVTATVTDGIGNTASVSKEYTCTDGYYAELSFGQDTYTFAYTEDGAVALSFGGQPSGASKGVEGVTFSQDGVLEYRDGAFYTVGTSKSGVKVTVRAKTYDGQTVSATCTVVVLRSAEEIGFPKGDALSVSTASLNLAEYISVSPQDHTDTFVFTADDPQAASVENGILLFKKEGRVIVTVETKNADGETTAQGSFTVNYQKAQAGDVVLTLEETEEASVTMPDLAFGLQSGVIDVRLSDEYTDVTFTVTEGADVVSVDAVGRVTLLKGGSAVVTVRAAKADGAVWERQVLIYSDRAADSIGLSLQDGFATSGKEYAVTATVSPADALAGKEFRFTADGGARVEYGEPQISEKDGTAVCTVTGRIVFAGAGTVNLTAGVYRGGEWSEGRSVTLRSTYGGLDEGGFTLTQDGSPVADGAQFTVANIGESLTFVLGTDFSPADFVPDADSVAVHAEGGFLDAEAVQENGVWKFVLTARKPTDGAATPVTVTVGGRTLTLNVRVDAFAETLQVFADGREPALTEGTQYDTLLPSLTFTVRLGRSDGAAVTQQKVLWEFGGQSGEAACTGGECRITVPVAENASDSLVFTSGDGKARFSVQLERLAALEDIGVVFRYTTAQGMQASAGQFESIRSLTETELRFPSAMQNSISLQIVLPLDLLGAYSDETFASLFAVNVPSGWGVAYEGELQTAILTPPSGAVSFRADAVLRHAGTLDVTFTLVRSGIRGIEFVGYDRTIESVFLGSQQVRVFAKHSYYDGKTVDYYKIPLTVTDADGSGGAMDLVQFSLVPYKGGAADTAQQGTEQSGRSVFYGGKTYEIQADGSLVCKDDSSVAVTADGKNTAGVPFVDPYTEQGYLRIYFGSFGGLNEEDVQSDAFGDFGEELDARTAESGTFLKITASDGAEGGVSESYNFNVMNDPSGATLVNVVDAAGYLNNKYVVLQTSLYHDAELSEPEKTERAAQILTSTDSGQLSKTLTYGNGFSVNFGAFNASVGENIGLSQGKVYNAVLKGTTASAGDSKENFNIYFTGTRFYYCDIQACHKGISVSGTTYIKNCVFRYHEDSSVYIYLAGTAYVENVFIIDGGDVAMEYTTGTFKFNGFVDGINFKNRNDLKEVTLGIESAAESILNTLKTSYSSYIWYDAGGDLYANIVAANISTFNNHTVGGADFYEQESGEYVNLSPEKGVVKTDPQTGLSLLYEETRVIFVVTVDIALLTYENQGEDSFIGYNCQYKDVNGSRTLNTDHIAWHAQRVHRDLSLVPQTGGSYGWELADHTEKLQASLGA